MTDADLQNYRRQLLALRRRISGDVVDIRGETPSVGGEADSGLPETLTDSADKSVHEYEEQVDRALEDNEEQLLIEIAAALTRLDAGTFGRCESCGQAIGQARLAAIPYARNCMACARLG